MLDKTRQYSGIRINTTPGTHEQAFSLLAAQQDALVIDIPCGQGAFVQRLLEHGYKNVIGVDIENHLANEHAGFVAGDMTRTLPFESASVSAAVSIDGIEHISRQFDFVAEIHRVLKNGGELILSTPNISSLRSRWKWFLTGHHHKCDSPLDENNPSPMQHIAMISLPELRYLLHTNGFRIKQVTTNRIKPVAWLFALALPFVYVATAIRYYRRGRKYRTAEINREMKQVMFSKSVLFGETLILRAIKV